MGKNKFLISALVLFMLSYCCFSKQVCFQIVQHDNRVEKVTEQSFVVEDELLKDFFEYGYIVTNSDASVSFSSDEDKILLNAGIQEAVEGCSDYFIQIKLYYESIGSSSLVSLRRIDWSVTNILNGETLNTKSLKVEKEYLTNDELIKLSSQLSDAIYKSLKA